MQSNILLIRHAQTHGNIADRIGYTDELDRLTSLGILQSMRIWPVIQSYIDNFKWRVNVACSETRRTYQTALHAWVIYPDSQFSIHWSLNEFESDGSFLSSLASLRRKDIVLPDGLRRVQDRLLSYIYSLDDTMLHILFSHGASIGTVYHGIHPELSRIPLNATINPVSLKSWNLTYIQ